MKHIILSTDAERYVYLAPDEVAKRLREYCLEFIEWLYDDPAADQFRKLGSKGSLYYSYDHTDAKLYKGRKQTVKRAADNKRRYAPGEGSIPPVLLSGVSKGVPPLAHDFACKV